MVTKVNHRAVLEADNGIRLDRWFLRHYPNLSHGKLQKLLRTGQVRLDSKRAKSGQRLQTGQIVRVPPIHASAVLIGETENSISSSDRAFIRGLVIAEDPLFFALNKPAGIAVQGGKGNRRNLDVLLPGLVTSHEERPRLVHRLDKDTSGVLLVARSAMAAETISKCFRHREAKKQYWALVAGVPNPLRGEINLSIRKVSNGKIQRVQPVKESGQMALTHYQTIETVGSLASWVILHPITGRTHQLRVHMAEIGNPILGDGKYGGKRAFLDAISPQMNLHAKQITIPHPGRDGIITIQAPLPPHMIRCWNFFGLDADTVLET
tara:strand:+ start:974 stop:1939 length:966 start_codon:yes stop_codon:yes gene_type:complete